MGRIYLLPQFDFFQTSPFGSLLLCVLNSLLLTFVEAGEEIRARLIVEIDLFNCVGNFSLLVVWRQNAFLGPGFGEHDGVG